MLSLVRSVIPPIHRGGLPIIGAAATGTLAARTALRAVGLTRPARWVTRTGIWATAATAAFFRAPVRVSPTTAGVVVAPADGTVALIEQATLPPELGLGSEPQLRVSIFLSVLDVHVQRVPVDGQVLAVEHRPGTFVSADLPEASDANSRTSLWVRGTDGHDLAVLQIAGLVARRILCDAAAGDELAAGDVYGLIRFGSRVDLLLPPGSRLLVEPGQRTVGGETVLAELPPPPTPADG